MIRLPFLTYRINSMIIFLFFIVFFTQINLHAAAAAEPERREVTRTVVVELVNKTDFDSCCLSFWGMEKHSIGLHETRTLLIATPTTPQKDGSSCFINTGTCCAFVPFSYFSAKRKIRVTLFQNRLEHFGILVELI